MNKLKKIPLTIIQKALLVFIVMTLFGMALPYANDDYANTSNETYIETKTTQEERVLTVIVMLSIGLIIIQPRKIKGKPQWMVKREIERERFKQENEKDRINRKKEEERIQQEKEKERSYRRIEKERIKQEKKKERINRKKEKERIRREKEQERIDREKEEERIKQEKKKEQDRIRQERIKFLEDNFTHIPAYGQKIYISSIRNSLIVLPYNVSAKINSVNDLVAKEISLDKVLSIELAVEEEHITNGVTTQGKSKTRTSLTSMVVRGAVGSLINPVVGVAGALTAVKKTKHGNQISDSRTKVVRDYSLVFYMAGEAPIVIKMGQQETAANNALQQVIYLINQARELKEA